jgi:hypothetical protein
MKLQVNKGVCRCSSFLFILDHSVNKMMAEISRVLRSGGLFVLITYGNPDWRLPYIEKPALKWHKVMVQQLPGTEKRNYVCL